MVIYTKMAVKMSNWGEKATPELLLQRANVEIGRHGQGTARDSGVYDQPAT